MKREYFVALGVLIVGVIALGVYWVWPQVEPKDNKFKEEIILPSYPHAATETKEVRAYLRALKKSQSAGEPFLPLPQDELDFYGRKVQTLLLRDKTFNQDAKTGGRALHNEMMRIVPAIVSTLSSDIASRCKKGKCYLAEKYNFAANSVTRAIVDASKGKILQIKRYADMQSEISQRLRKVAEAIVLSAPEVRQKLKRIPKRKDITMANVRGAMRYSPCENTKHLCVAPTFADVKRGRALWAVVDLTELRLAAAKWAPLGKSATPACISERILQNRFIMENFCQKDTSLQKGKWKLTYRLTGSDGLEIRDVSFDGVAVLKSAKVVDWHVSYAGEGASRLDRSVRTYIEGREVEFVDLEGDKYMFGYNDAMGCPMFSTSVVLPFGKPQVLTLPEGKGFALVQDFRNPKWPLACNYRYENRFEFYPDGSFRIIAINKGRGCGKDALYRPVMRIDLAGLKNHLFLSGDKTPIRKEFYERVPPQKKHPYTITSEEGFTYAIEPNHGQFADRSRGDDARIFFTRFHPDEGDTDLLTLGSCCKLDEDGPERYVNEEIIAAQDLVIWYVPRIRNDARKGSEYCWADTVIDDRGNLSVKVWPCAVGPKFLKM